MSTGTHSYTAPRCLPGVTEMSILWAGSQGQAQELRRNLWLLQGSSPGLGRRCTWLPLCCGGSRTQGTLARPEA